MLPDAVEVKAKRRKLGLTQTELAKEAGVSQSLVAKIESGRVDASYSHLKKIFDCLGEIESQASPKAKDLLNENVFPVQAADSVSKAISLMRKHGFSQLPVFEKGHVVGSISEKNIIDKISEGFDSKQLSKLECSEIMEDAFPTVSETTPLPAVSELLKHHYAILVRKGRKISGIITKSDLLKTVR